MATSATTPNKETADFQPPKDGTATPRRFGSSLVGTWGVRA